MAVKTSPVNIEERKQLGIAPGDTVRVWTKVQEKGKTRLQPFEGLVLARKHGTEAGATFTVRGMLAGVGVERIFPLYSPNIDRIEILRRAKVRRSKLYYIRKKVARDVRRHMRNMVLTSISTESEMTQQQRAEQQAEEAQSERGQDAEENAEETQNDAGGGAEEGADETQNNAEEGTKQAQGSAEEGTEGGEEQSTEETGTSEEGTSEDEEEKKE